MRWSSALAGGAAALGALATHDLLQKRHTILRNFPVIGHGRYAVEKLGPELRQYVVASDDEERPFSRDQREWVYASAKQQNSYAGFGTDNDVEGAVGYPVVKHRTFAGAGVDPTTAPEDDRLPGAKVLGGPRGRRHAFRPASVVNVSAMSFGSLSGPAVHALNEGVREAGCLQNTGEGGLSRHHQRGGELVFQIGTGYFGCRSEDGRFDLAQLKDLVEQNPVRALEVKLSQGAKPGLGGMLPGKKVTAEIAEARGVEVGEDCFSPSRHSAFGDVDSMLDFVEMLAAETGLPVGIKAAVGNLTVWDELVRQMEAGTAETRRGVDFVTVDGGEGGTGAAPLLFADAVSYPFRVGFTEVYRRFAAAGLVDRLTFVGSGKLGVPENAVVAMALGADLLNVGREAMFALGCIQARKCHTDRCPTGVATQDPRFTRGLVTEDKSERVTHYVRALRRDLRRLAAAVGVDHPGLITPADIDLMDGQRGGTSLAELYGYEDGWGGLGDEVCEDLRTALRDGVPG